MFDFKLISAIILLEIRVHLRVIGQIARDAASVCQNLITGINLALKVAMFTEYEQLCRLS